MASGSAHPPGPLRRVVPGRAGFPPLTHHGTPQPTLFPMRPLPAAGMDTLHLPVLQPAACCGPGEGLLHTLEISGRAETPFKQQALPDSVHQHRGGRDLARGRGDILAMDGLFQFLCSSPMVLQKQMAT